MSFKAEAEFDAVLVNGDLGQALDELEAQLGLATAEWAFATKGPQRAAIER